MLQFSGIKIVPHITTFAWTVKQHVESLTNLRHGHSPDEAASIYLYTMEWTIREESLYHKLNTALRTPNREDLKPYLPYLSALLKMPRFNSTNALWRGVRADIADRYKTDKTKHQLWWGFSSCTVDMETSVKFLGDETQARVLFNVHFASHAVDIQEYSSIKSEKEVILLPARNFQVMSIGSLGANPTIIELQETTESLPSLLIGLPPQSNQDSPASPPTPTGTPTKSVSNQATPSPISPITISGFFSSSI